MRELALFAGAGGGIRGGKMLGWRTVCAVEIEKYPRNVLLQRQRDGILDNFPIWDDVRTFDGNTWRGKVDVISGGFPCQDISSAGRGLGIERGERSGLWREYARIIREVRPRYCFVENSPMLASRGLGIVLGDLAALGYDAAWKVLSAGDCGAPHERARMWIVGKISDSYSLWKQQSQRNITESRRRPCDLCKEIPNAVQSRQFRHVSEGQFNEQVRLGAARIVGIREKMADAAEPRLQDRNGEPRGEILAQSERLGDEISNAVQDGLQGRRKDWHIQRPSGLRGGKGTDEIKCLSDAKDKRNVRRIGSVDADGPSRPRGEDDGQGTASDWCREWWKAEPGLGRVADGVANRVDRIKAIGNGQVPMVAARAFCELMEVLDEHI